MMLLSYFTNAKTVSEQITVMKVRCYLTRMSGEKHSEFFVRRRWSKRTLQVLVSSQEKNQRDRI